MEAKKFEAGSGRSKGELLRERRTAARIPAGAPEGERRSGDDRRRAVRLTIQVGCEERSGSSWFFRTTVDVSITGLSIATGACYPRNTRLRLMLQLPDDPPNPLAVEAVVIGPYNRQGGMRLSFIEPSLDVCRRIHNSIVLCALKIPPLPGRGH